MAKLNGIRCLTFLSNQQEDEKQKGTTNQDKERIYEILRATPLRNGIEDGNSQQTKRQQHAGTGATDQKSTGHDKRKQNIDPPITDTV